MTLHGDTRIDNYGCATMSARARDLTCWSICTGERYGKQVMDRSSACGKLKEIIDRIPQREVCPTVMFATVRCMSRAANTLPAAVDGAERKSGMMEIQLIDANQRAAKWVLHLGGLGIAPNNQQWRWRKITFPAQ